jgi:hypothetical protein
MQFLIAEEKWKVAEQLESKVAEQLGKKRKGAQKMGLRWLPRASPSKQQQLPTPAYVSGPFKGCQKMIHNPF